MQNDPTDSTYEGSYNSYYITIDFELYTKERDCNT